MPKKVKFTQPIFSFPMQVRIIHSQIYIYLLLLFLIFISLLSNGCMDIHMRIGKRPNPDVLEKNLRIGQSSTSDILAALGEPDGKGREMLPIVQQPRTLWSYYYEEGDLKDSRRIFLFVFIKQDRYNGYMWFSSLPEK